MFSMSLWCLVAATANFGVVVALDVKGPTDAASQSLADSIDHMLSHGDEEMAKFLDAQQADSDERALQSSRAGSTGLMQRWSTDGDCEGGLRCKTTALVGRYMIDEESTNEKVSAFNEKYDVNVIKAAIYEDSGVTDEELILALGPPKMFQGPGKRVGAFLAPEPWGRFQQSARKHWEDAPTLELSEMLEECTEDTRSHPTAKYGFIHAEFGAIADLSTTQFS